MAPTLLHGTEKHYIVPSYEEVLNTKKLAVDIKLCTDKGMTRNSRGNRVDKTLRRTKTRLNDLGKSFAYCRFHQHIGFDGYVGLARLENIICSLPDSGIVSILVNSDVDNENSAVGTIQQDRIRAQGYGTNTFLYMTVSASWVHLPAHTHMSTL